LSSQKQSSGKHLSFIVFITPTLAENP